MRLAIATTLALSLAAVVVAAPAAASTFQRNGSRYEYSYTDKPNGVVLIDGRALDDGSSFSLRVVADRVTGTMDDRPVAFTISKEMSAAPTNERSNAIASK